jgi:hypothetical protein
VLYRLIDRHEVVSLTDSEIYFDKLSGIGVPIDSWLRREWYFHVEPIRRKWKEHLSGKRSWQRHIWSILMFQAWLEANHG